MIKRMSFIKKKAGMSAADFRHHFETVHVPLGLAHFTSIKEYRRNYLTTVVRKPEGSGGAAEYDAVTEIWFETQDDYDAYVSLASRADVRPLFVADEAKFIEPDTLWSFIVEEVQGA